MKSCGWNYNGKLSQFSFLGLGYNKSKEKERFNIKRVSTFKVLRLFGWSVLFSDAAVIWTFPLSIRKYAYHESSTQIFTQPKKTINPFSELKIQKYLEPSARVHPPS